MPDSQNQTNKNGGGFVYAGLVILITAGILCYASSFAGDNETIGFLQGYAIPCLTVLALIITTLIAFFSEQSKRKEEEPTQVSSDQSMSKTKIESTQKEGEQQ